MRWQVRFSKGAEKQFRALPRKEQLRIAVRIDALAENPLSAGVKKLSGEEAIYRLRSGDYRILYAIHDDVLTVLVLKIGHRREIYR